MKAHYKKIVRSITRLILFFCFCIIQTGISYAQVNLQTGSASFSVPIFSWQDHKGRLNSMIALSYSSGSGLKVSDVASNVGQGWNLISGGVITRLQVGEPDDQLASNGNGTQQDISKYPSGFLFASIPAGKGCPDALTRYPLYKAKNQVYSVHNVIAEDKQLDYFSFQFNGKAGMFILNKGKEDIGLSLGDSKMKITFQRDLTLTQRDIRTIITSFTIQDVDGLIYKFSTPGFTKVLETSFCNADMSQRQDQPKLKRDKVFYQAAFENSQFRNPLVIGSWYLTEVKDPLTQRKIVFNYEEKQLDNLAGYDISYNSDGNYSIISHKRSITKTPEITSIVYPDKHRVTFNYGQERADFKGLKVISSIDVTYNGRFISKHVLNTTYFIKNRYGTPNSDYQKSVARLCLKSVKKIGVDLKEETPPYSFDYYLGSNAPDDFVPPPFFFAKDIWGFYNGDKSRKFDNSYIDLNKPLSELKNNECQGLCYQNNSVAGINLNPKSGYAKNGLLKQIIYPTGGTLSYDYEQNTGILNGVNRMIGGIHVKETSSTDGGFSNGCGNPVTTSYKYILNQAGDTSSIWGLEMPVNSMATTSRYEPKDKKYKWCITCGIFGKCYYKFMYPGILSQRQAVSLNGLQKTMEKSATVLGIVSLVSTVMDIVTVAFATTPLAVVALVVDVIGGIVTVVLTCFTDYSKNTATTVYYNVDLNAVSPLPTQFKRVEIIENPATIGKTVQEFTSIDDYPLWEVKNTAFSAKQRFAPWAYGLPKLTTIFDVNGNKIKQTENVFNFSVSKNEVGNCLKCPWEVNPVVSCKCLVNHSASQPIDDWNNSVIYNEPLSYRTDNTNAMKVNIYSMYTGRTQLTKTYERIYKVGDPTLYVENSIEYQYNWSNYQVSDISNYQSNGDMTRKNIRYADEFTTGVFGALNQNNIISIPISTTTTLFTGNNNYNLGESVTEFSQLPNGDIKPYRTLEQRFNQPQSAGVTYYNPNDPANSTKYKQTQVFNYDASGNLVGLKDEGGRVVTNVYDYDDKYIVASVVNAQPLVDRSAYTSFETQALGGWSVNGAAIYDSILPSVTGTRSFSLQTGANSLTVNSLNANKSNKVSFWATNNSISVSGGPTLMVSAPTINGFTYYEYEVPQGTTVITLTGNGRIDELRVYPKTARMRTVTYDVILGKTSECDENNRVTYYEYDNVGRLRFIKDDKRNIVKMYEYNNVSRLNGCPATYYSLYARELFRRGNCVAGYQGGDTTYTVPANKYSSAFSQEDADAQVHNEILANGQAFANSNAGCKILYYNVATSKSDTTDNCTAGYVGGVVTYTVPAGRYSSTISQADADTLAFDEIDANLFGYVNNPTNASCTITTQPQWSWESGAMRCENINGQLPAHQFIEEIDLNPNSTSYYKTRWSDVGPTDACPSNSYYNASQSEIFTKSCPAGYTGSNVTFYVNAGKYSSTISMAAANQLAIDEINANGQAYANSMGTCQQNSTCDVLACSYYEGYKCVLGICELGYKVYTSSTWDSSMSQYACVYHYEYSDGSWSQDYTEYNNNPCPLY